MLDKAEVRPPFVLVGHSYGGWLVRLYAYTYAPGVAGMVLIEAGGTNPWRLQPNGRLVRASELATGKPMPALQTSNPLKESDMPPAALTQMKLAAQGARANGTPFISFFTPTEMVALARESGFRDARHVSAAALTQRYFAGRTDGLRPPNNSEELLLAHL